MSQARFQHSHACHTQTLLQLGSELVGNLLLIAPERNLVAFGVFRIVRVCYREGAHCGLDLNRDKLLVRIDIEKGLGTVDHPPDDDTGDLDRTAARVVDLDDLAVEIAYAQ